MRRTLKIILSGKSIFTGIVALSFFGSVQAQAQSSDYLTPQSDQLGFNAGVKLALPLGAKSKAQSHKAKLGLTLSLDNVSQSRWTGVTSRRSVDLLEIGLFENGQPNLSLLGQDIYTPLFDPLYADEAGDKNSSNTALYIIGGAVVVVGGVLLLADAIADELVDCIETVTQDNPNCG